MPFASIYPLYVQKATKKGQTKEQVDKIIQWLTGYDQNALEIEMNNQTDLETFYAKAPRPNPSRKLITGVICGIRVEEIGDPTMQEIRYMDKLVDELARGKSIDKILRS